MVYFAVDLFHQMYPGATGPKIALDLFVPYFVCQLFKPVSKLLAVRLREMDNRFLDSVQRHALTIAPACRPWANANEGGYASSRQRQVRTKLITPAPQRHSCSETRSRKDQTCKEAVAVANRLTAKPHRPAKAQLRRRG